MGRASSPLAGRLIFVVGARRSGTNWLQRVMAAHPRVAAVPSESFLFSHGLRPLQQRFQHGALSSSATGKVYANQDVVLDGMRDLCDAVFADLIRGLKPSADYLVERTPHHAHHMDLIGDIYPDGQFIHIIRDGRDVVRSLLSQEWMQPDTRQAAREWKDTVEAARTNGSALAHYHEVRYEEMLDAPDRVISKLFTDLGLEPTDADVDRAGSEARARFNVDRADTRVAANKWEQGLDDKTLGVVLDEAADLLTSLGYQPGSAPGAKVVAATGARDRQASGEGRARSRLRLKRKLRRWRSSTPAPQSGGGNLEGTQWVAERFLSLAVTDPSGARALLLPDAHVRIVTETDSFEGRGDEAGVRLVEYLRSDKAWQGRQALGYLHPSTPAFTFVGRFEIDGLQYPRVIILYVVGHGISRVACYAFEPTPAEA